MYRLGILGLGKMGSSILDGIISSGKMSKDEIYLYMPNVDKQSEYKNNGFRVASNELDLFLNSKIILLAIKPQKFNDVLNIAKEYDFSNRVVLSIAAGKTIETINEYFRNAFVVRAMPNTPALIKSGATAVSYNGKSSALPEVLMILECIGTTEIIPENQMDDIIPVNGSMPAYLYSFAKEFINIATEKGIDYDVAKKLCCESIIGSAKMILESNDSIDTLIKNVCSPNGTTIAGLDALYDANFKDAINKCFNACADRSRQLGEVKK